MDFLKPAAKTTGVLHFAARFQKISRAILGSFLLVLVSLSAAGQGTDPLPSQPRKKAVRDSPDSTRQLEEIVITYQADRLTPIPFQDIPSKEIKTKLTGQEPSFLLAETPSVTNYSDAGSSNGYSYFRIRGIDQTRVNVTLDGVPLNEPEDQGVYFSNFPDLFSSASRVQIQRGVGISKNGTASYGGSIQLFSPDLNDSSRTAFGISYGSFNSIRFFAEHNSGIKNRTGFYARASQIQSDGFKYNAANNGQSFFLSGGLFSTRSRWKFNLMAGRQRNGLAWLGVTDSLIQIDRRTNANSIRERDKFIQTTAQLQNSWQVTQSSFLQSGVYHSFLEGNYDFDLNNFLELPPTAELFNYAFRSHLVGAFTNFHYSTESFHWTTGVHGNRYQRVHTGSEQQLGNLYQNTGFKNEWSAFTKAEYSLRWVTFFADFQLRQVNFDYRGQVPFNRLAWLFFNPKGGVTISVDDQTTVYYSLGRTGREPTRNDMFGANDDLLADSNGQPLLSNTQAESVVAQETGFRYRNQKFRLGVNLYYMDFKNEIVLAGNFGPNGLALTNNVERSYRAGLELDGTYQITNRILLSHASSFNHSRIREQNEVFSPILTPPIIINQEVTFSEKQFSISISGRYQQGAFINFANTEALQRYLLVNGRANYQFNRIQLALFVNNLTNRKYFNQGYVGLDGVSRYFVQAPVNFVLSAQCQL